MPCGVAYFQLKENRRLHELMNHFLFMEDGSEHFRRNSCLIMINHHNCKLVFCTETRLTLLEIYYLCFVLQ